MLDQFSEQVKKSTQPASDLFAANLKALQAVSQQHTALVSGVLTDSMKLLQSLSAQTEMKGVLAAQGMYAESVRERITATSKINYGTINVVGQQFADAMKTTFDTSVPAKAEKAATGKTVVAKVALRKPAVTKVKAKKSAPKPAAQSKSDEVIAPVVLAEEAKTSVTPKAATKPQATKRISPKKLAKPVPTLSADNVRAIPKKEQTKESIEVVSAPTDTVKA